MKILKSLITLSIVSQFSLLPLAIADCKTPGAETIKINGNNVCARFAQSTNCNGNIGIFGRVTPLDGNGMPGLYPVAACSFRGNCGSKSLNGQTIQLKINLKTGNCFFPEINQQQCSSPNTWSGTVCEASPRIRPNCPSGSSLGQGGIGKYGCYQPTIICNGGTMYVSGGTTYCIVN